MKSLIRENIQNWRLVHNIDIRPLIDRFKLGFELWEVDQPAKPTKASKWLTISKVTLIICSFFWHSGEMSGEWDMAVQILAGNCIFFYEDILLRVGRIVILDLLLNDLIGTWILFQHLVTQVQKNGRDHSRRAVKGQLVLMEHLAALVKGEIPRRSRLAQDIYLTLMMTKFNIRLIILIMILYLLTAFLACVPHTPFYISLITVSTAIHGVVWSQIGISYIFTMFLMHHYISYKIHQIKSCESSVARNAAKLSETICVTSNEDSVLMDIDSRPPNVENSSQMWKTQMKLTCKTLRDLYVFKTVMGSVQIADRNIWGKLFILHTTCSFVLFINLTYQGLFITGLPVLLKTCLYPSMFIVYVAMMAPLMAAGHFVKSIRKSIPHLVRLSYLWPDLPTQPKGQLLISELVIEIGNPNRGSGLC